MWTYIHNNWSCEQNLKKKKKFLIFLFIGPTYFWWNVGDLFTCFFLQTLLFLQPFAIYRLKSIKLNYFFKYVVFILTYYFLENLATDPRKAGTSTSRRQNTHHRKTGKRSSSVLWSKSKIAGTEYTGLSATRDIITAGRAQHKHRK